jgi:hypothetical protein
MLPPLADLIREAKREADARRSAGAPVQRVQYMERIADVLQALEDGDYDVEPYDDWDF